MGMILINIVKPMGTLGRIVDAIVLVAVITEVLHWHRGFWLFWKHRRNIPHFFLAAFLVLILFCIIFITGMVSISITLLSSVMMHFLNEQLKVASLQERLLVDVNGTSLGFPSMEVGCSDEKDDGDEEEKEEEEEDEEEEKKEKEEEEEEKEEEKNLFHGRNLVAEWPQD
ncbi:GLIPR1-like protein 2 [Numida meleagris]|uniref:GLIPR1-like protein 2 n=1 Tax=Numida meleagris TaxID=8996 RepID=UPI000B3DA283|nr:GLIPR1-like protein 2 [Numida meleagris]